MTDWLANLTTAKVLVAVGILMVLIALLRLVTRSRERGAGLLENLQVVLSVVDGHPAVHLSSEGGSKAVYSRQQPTITDDRAELLGYGDMFRILVTAVPEVRSDPYQVTVNGKVELESPAGLIQERSGLQEYG